MSSEKVDYQPAPAADFVLAFDLPQLGLRGRVVRMDAVSARALAAHTLPEPAARVLGEALVLSTLLGSTLKLDGRLTVQTKSDGPLNLVTVDYYGAEDDRSAGVRGFARLKETQFAKPPSFAELAGGGVLAITIEPRREGQTYQGIVSLSADGIAASAETYFAQSEQLPTAIRLAAAPAYVPGRSEPQWRAGGIMLQATPEAARVDDDWNRLSMILSTVDAFELLDTALSAETLLWRLFNEDEVRVHPAETLSFRCDCDGGRIASVLRSYSAKDREGLADSDGIIRAKCEFCGTVHEIGTDALA
ncbi:MAG TPA: Hsp33 family molecular chaperone HslO [Rhizomicrobium sp.]|nr:Hsp33 family molecular chaperone HslO [Rhizomicrobium sp.]